MVSGTKVAVKDLAIVAKLRDDVHHEFVVDAEEITGDVVTQTEQTADSSIFAIHEITDILAGNAKFLSLHQTPNGSTG